MCLSKVVAQNADHMIQIAESVQDVSIEGNEISFIDIIGRKTVIQGKIKHIDLVKNVITVKKEN